MKSREDGKNEDGSDQERKCRPVHKLLSHRCEHFVCILDSFLFFSFTVLCSSIDQHVNLFCVVFIHPFVMFMISHQITATALNRTATASRVSSVSFLILLIISTSHCFLLWFILRAFYETFFDLPKSTFNQLFSSLPQAFMLCYTQDDANAEGMYRAQPNGFLFFSFLSILQFSFRLKMLII